MSEMSFKEFQNDLEFVNALFKQLPEAVANKAAHKALNRHGRAYVGTMQKSIRGSKDDRDTLHRRTGALARAFNSTVVNIDGSQKLIVWLDKTVDKYWKPHEFGATIKASPGKSLAIPVGPALTPAGVPKYNSPRDIPDLVMLQRLHKEKGKMKAPVLGRMEGDKFVVYFVLTKSVKIPARLGLRSNWQEQLPNIVGTLREETQNAINEMSNK